MKTTSRIIFIMLAWLTFISCKKNDGPSVRLSEGLYTWLPFNGNKEDSVGTDNDIIYSDLGTSMVKDRKNTPAHALFFDGSEGEIWYQNIDWPADQLTVSCWIRKANNLQMLSFITAEDVKFGMFQELDKVSFMVRKGSTLNYPEPVAIEFEWTHLLATFDSKEIKFYVNGEMKSSLPLEVTLAPVDLLVLGFSDGTHWRGNMDDMRIYGRVLNSAEIKTLATQ